MAFMGVFAALGFGRFGYSAVLPAMQDALGINSAAAGSLASWNLAGYTIMSAVGGVLAAKLGARKVVTAGIVVTAAGMLITGLADGLALASMGRLLAGVGNGLGQTFGPYVGGVLGDVFSSLGPTYYISGGIFILGAAGALALRGGAPPLREQLVHGRPRLPVKRAPLR